VAILEVGARSPDAVAVNELAELRASAEAGDAEALSELIHMLVASEDAAHHKEAMQLLEAAGDRGDASALRQHAALAARGVGRAKSFDDALSLLSRAAALGEERAQSQLSALGGRIEEHWFAPPQLQQHHQAPRIFTVENFIPTAACAWFIEYARRRPEASTVRDGATGQDIVSPGRSATTAGSSALESDLVLQLTKLRIAQALEVPAAHQEPTTILRYEPGQEYLAHYDLIRPQEEAAAADELRLLGQRVATVLVYLNDGYEGGETFFPHLDWGFKGKPGDALIFWNMSASGERERLSLHAGLSVATGEKWLLSQWVRAKPVPLI
jgi:TPR repeat protein